MKLTHNVLSVAGVVAGFALFGCSNTADGVAKDASTDATVAANATKQAGAAVKDTAVKAGDAVKDTAAATGEAVKDTAQKAGDATAKAAVDAGKAVDNATKDVQVATKDASKNASAALSLTPKVKAALLADTELGASGNRINVDSADNVCHLKGTVMSETLKKKAEHVAKQTIKDAGATDTVSNELTVSAGKM